MSGRILKFVVVLAAALIAGAAVAEETSHGGLVIKDAWARATIGQGKTGAVYFSIANRGGKADRLLAVETPVAKRADLHAHLVEGGIMKMRPVAEIEVAGRGTATLEPGAGHVMLMGLNGPLVEGARFTMTLVFESAGRVEIPVSVAGATAMRPAGHGGSGQGHGGMHHGSSKQ